MESQELQLKLSTKLIERIKPGFSHLNPPRGLNPVLDARVPHYISSQSINHQTPKAYVFRPSSHVSLKSIPSTTATATTTSTTYSEPQSQPPTHPHPHPRPRPRTRSPTSKTRLQTRNRRKQYLDTHPEYFQSPHLESAGKVSLLLHSPKPGLSSAARERGLERKTKATKFFFLIADAFYPPIAAK